MRYAILNNPGHNRVFYEAMQKLAFSEFDIVARKLSVSYHSLQNQLIAGISYLTFETPGELTGTDITLLSELSFAYALYMLDESKNDVSLKPIQKTNVSYIDTGISEILKYTGKTNELFTRMLINIAFSTQSCPDNLNLLDPVSGKGTTLFEGLIRGFNVYGIEIGEKPVSEAFHFFQKFIELKRYKFEMKTMKLSGPNKSFSSVRHTFKIGRTKQEQKEGSITTAEFIAGNSQYASAYYPKDFFSMIVGDLPYGIQHGNITNEKRSSLTRNPAELLKACLPAWEEVLCPGGCLVLAWNSHVLNRETMTGILEAHGLSVKNEGAYAQFEHRVDQSIKRDVIAGVKQNNSR